MLTSLVILQALNLCNLDCSYCYLGGRRNKGQMDPEMVDLVFRKLFARPDLLVDPLTLVWHAGEPLLAGPRFFEHAARSLARHKPDGLTVKHQIQTNATLIDDDWCRLFGEHAIDVSVSLDGPKFIHDRHRVDWGHRGSFDRVMTGVESLKANGLAPRGIAVVTDFSMDYPDEVFRTYHDNGFAHMSLNVEEIDGANSASSLGHVRDSESLARSERRYGGFVRRIFDLWLDSDRTMGIRDVSLALRSLRFRALYPGEFAPSSETMAMAILAIGRNGEITTFSPELSPSFASGNTDYVVANIRDIRDLEDVARSRKLAALAQKVHAGTRRCAQTCETFDVCGGGSPSNKLFELGTFDGAETSYCRLHKKVLFGVIERRLQELSIDAARLAPR